MVNSGLVIRSIYLRLHTIDKRLQFAPHGVDCFILGERVVGEVAHNLAEEHDIDGGRHSPQLRIRGDFGGAEFCFGEVEAEAIQLFPRFPKTLGG